MKIQVNARNRAHQFEVEAGEKILYGGLSEAVELPYECASGTCGTCRARLVSGEIVDGWQEAPGRRYLKSPDEFLMCQCSARSDAVIEVASFVQTMEAGACTPAAIGGRIKAVERLTHDVALVEVELDTSLEFDAGQFMLVQVPDVLGFRGWSMVNYERRCGTLEFVVKKKPGGGISEWLFGGAREGVEVKLFGPLGHATFYPSVAKNVLCIAGGTGIAGMMSILARAAQDGYFTQYDGNVFFGVRGMKDAFFLDRFATLREQCGKRLRVVVALSEEAPPASVVRDYPQLVFEQGFVHEVAGRSMQDRYHNVRAYLAGPPPAVDASIRMLLQARVTADNIRYDKFS
jgi:toluene monooxygenase electron transfer component